ncbi:MAG: tRNA1(Val) (adenine(37)-N6)-methyltransferase [Firmicutes bacterium]|nr:tRNA1(Val) (adenine(37)-N6)-methyltransferase [Bacillota bacterium]
MEDKMKTTLREGERLDDTGFSGYRLIQKPEEFCYGVDAVLLANFASKHARNNHKICDLGTGTGIVPLVLAHKTEARQIVGVELQQDSWDRAMRMRALNQLEDRLAFVNTDVLTIAGPKLGKKNVAKLEGEAVQLLQAGTFQIVTTNPPYMAGASALQSHNDAKRIARHETTAGVREFVAAAARLLDERGEFCMVHRPSRLADIIAACREFKLEPKELQMVAPRLGEAPNILLIRCKKGGGAELNVLPTLPVYGEDGQYSKEIMEIYERI